MKPLKLRKRFSFQKGDESYCLKNTSFEKSYKRHGESSQLFSKSVLVVGAYLLSQPNNIIHIIKRLNDSLKWNLVQRWAAVGEGAILPETSSVTAFQGKTLVPKFALMNKLLNFEGLEKYEYVIICDDDIGLPGRFLDRYFEFVARYDLALAQPARTWGSYTAYRFVRQLPGIRARCTRFVEIGPLFSIRRDLYERLLPFDESSPMGWGYDFVWPCIVEDLGLRMGIVDAVCVRHSLRKQYEHYDSEGLQKVMEKYLSTKPHLSNREAFCILESYPRIPSIFLAVLNRFLYNK